MRARPAPPFALVRRPAESLASGCVSFIERQPVDVERARRQWLAYVAALNSRGWPTVEVKSAVTALPDGTVVGYGPLVDDAGAFPSFLAVPEEGGAHVVVLDEQTVLMSAHAPRTAHLLGERGLNVVTVDISEFEKLEGCVTCLSVRVRAGEAVRRGRGRLRGR
jgi:dimethylargininase